jgi:hypothetical protein
MKRFIYLDTNELNSYIAQISNGLTTKREQNHAANQEDTNKLDSNIKASLNVGAKLKYLFNLDTSIEGGLSTSKESNNSETIIDIETKIIHDEAFDMFLKYLESEKLLVFENYKVGDFVKCTAPFEIFDLEYFSNWFIKNGIIDFLKETNKQSINNAIQTEKDKLSRSDKHSNITVQHTQKYIKELVDSSNKEYDSIENIINALKSVLPYDKIIMSNEFFLVTSDNFFRDKPEMVGFKYGGKISFVGYVTNTVVHNQEPVTTGDNVQNPLSNFKTIANNTILSVISQNKDIYILHPIAIYYE